MSKKQVLTYAALLILPFSVYQNEIGYPLIAQISGIIAFLFAYLDFNQITNRSHFITIYLTSILLAFISGGISEFFLLSSVSIIISTIGFSIRLAFIKQLSYSRYRYLELCLLIINVPLVVIVFTSQPDKWYYLFPTLVFLAFHVGYTFVVIQNAQQLEKGVENGYKAKAGTQAPNFSLPDYDGNLVSLSDYKNKRFILLIFVRGDWCPYCHMILRTYMREKEKFQSKNIMLISIGPDPVGVNREMATKLGLDYKVLSDQGMKVASEYGIQLPDYRNFTATKHDEGMPLPASFLIDTKGKVIYTSRTTKVGEFLDPNLIFPILDSID